MEPYFDVLSKIQPLQTPEFLMTRIQQRIRQRQQEMVSTKYAFTLAATMLLLLTVNVVALRQQLQQRKPIDVAQELITTLENNFYHE